MKKIQFCLILSVILGYFFIVPSVVKAQTCVGNVACGVEQSQCLPNGCTQYQCNNTLGGCSWKQTCNTADTIYKGCNAQGGNCNPQGCGPGRCYVSDSCGWSSPAPTPAPTSTPNPTPTPVVGCTSDGVYDSCTPKSDCGPIGTCSVCQKRTAVCTDNCGNARDSCSSDNTCDQGNPANCVGITPPPPTCTSFNYFDEPPDNSTLTVGQTYNLRGWAIFCDGCGDPRNMYAVDLWQCQPPGTTTNCKYLGGAGLGFSRPDTVGYCGGNPGNNGWRKDSWTIPADSLIGQQTLWSVAINTSEKVGGSYKWTNWRRKDVTIITPIPTPTPTPIPIPTCPSGTSATDSQCDNTGVTITWVDNSNNELGFRVYRDGGLIYTTGANVTSYKDTGVTCNGSLHTYQVYSYNASGACTGPSDIGSCNLPALPSAPACSSFTCNLASAPGAATTCTIGWTAVPGATRYLLRVDDLADPWPGALDVYQDNLISTSYPFTGYGGHTLRPWFHAADVCSQIGPPGSCPDLIVSSCPATPLNLTATRNLCDVILKWTDNSTNEQGFMVQRSLDGAPFSDWRSVGAGVTGTTDSNVFCGASPAVSAKYRVFAIYTGCVRSYSNEATASCPLDATTTTLTIVPDPLPDIVMGKTASPYFSYDVVLQCGTFDHITFTYDPSSLASLSPTSSSAEPGTVSVTAGMTPGSTTIIAKVYLKPGPILALTKNIPVNIIAPPAWWQTKDGDVHGNTGITSLIPAVANPPRVLSLPGDGGDPGVVSYGGTLSLDVGSVSEKGWQAQTTYHEDKIDFGYLMNRLNVDTNITLPAQDIPNSNGTYYSGGAVNLNGRNVNNDKVIIFVNGDATVTSDIKVGKSGFFALIAKGNITFNAGVKEAHGFYLADSTLSVAAGADLFKGEGSFIGWGGVSMGRDLGASTNNLTPSETFLFRPDLLINAPKEFLFAPFVFQEVAP